jgi:hypothetical protein
MFSRQSSRFERIDSYDSEREIDSRALDLHSHHRTQVGSNNPGHFSLSISKLHSIPARGCTPLPLSEHEIRPCAKRNADPTSRESRRRVKLDW